MFLTVTGAPRSGTRFAAAMLQEHGLDVGHEREGVDGIVSWYLTGQTDSAPYGPGPNEMIKRADRIVHQIRHPLDVIGSLLQVSGASLAYIAQVLEIQDRLGQFTPLSFAAIAWLAWNQRAQTLAEGLTYRVEDVSIRSEHVGEMLGIAIQQELVPPAGINPRPHPEVEWSHIQPATLEQTVRGYAAEFGYW